MGNHTPGNVGANKMKELGYLPGFGNHFSSEALPEALPVGQNSPQKCAYGLYAEQLSGTAFTATREELQRSWLYRIRPSVMHSAFSPLESGLLKSAPFQDSPAGPTQMRWDPLPIPSKATDFLQGLCTMAGCGDAASGRGSTVHHYSFNAPMGERYFYNGDGDFLFVPEHGGVSLQTEFGTMTVEPGEIAVIQRGIRFQVSPAAKAARGYLCENHGAHFRLPYLGPIGANGLANPRDFQTPEARYEDREGKFRLIAKFQGKLWQAELGHSPLDVVAWHGNYAPYKYNLAHFGTINTVSFDHPDPSIFTVLTSPSDRPGVANLDFVIFPPRWMVAEHTFRPPYYHRNIMSEYMGLVRGTYDAKQTGFAPGGSSLHNCMSGHGPDAQAFSSASQVKLQPAQYTESLAIMFESSMVYQPTRFAMETPALQKTYLDCWKGLPKKFNPGGKNG